MIENILKNIDGETLTEIIANYPDEGRLTKEDLELLTDDGGYDDSQA